MQTAVFPRFTVIAPMRLGDYWQQTSVTTYFSATNLATPDDLVHILLFKPVMPSERDSGPLVFA